MLDPREASEIQQSFGVSPQQVLRDHAISHVLSVLTQVNSEFVFYGGTGLARTYLADGRLSEDIDLYSEKRERAAREIQNLPDWLEQEFPDARWILSPMEVADPKGALLSCGPEIQIKIQIVNSAGRGWVNVPVALTRIEQRFSDVPETCLPVPTLDGFVAMKAVVWFERRASRDLFDLGGLAKLGPVTEGARDTVEKLLGYPLSSSMIRGSISGDWRIELGHQTKDPGDEAACLARVLAWWGE